MAVSGIVPCVIVHNVKNSIPRVGSTGPWGSGILPELVDWNKGALPWICRW